MNFCILIEIWGEKIDKNISKTLSSKYSQNLLDHAKQSATDALETASKRVTQKKAEVTCDLIDNKTADKITRVLKTSPQNNSVTNKQERLKESYSSPDGKQKSIDDLRII